MYTVDEILDMNFQTITLHMKGTKRLLKSETSCTLYQSEAGMTTWMKFLKRGQGSGERYHFSIYHVERLACSSSLFLETTNFQFITDPEDEPPRDYVVSLNEDFHLNGIVAELALSDIFSQGPPFDISILRGNEARHFTLKDDTTTSRTAAVAPAVVPPTYTTIDGLSYVECGSPSTITPEGNDPTVETFNINTQTALFTLDLSLDYEVVTLYTVVIQVEDNVKTPPSTGTITVKEPSQLRLVSPLSTGTITVKISISSINWNHHILCWYLLNQLEPSQLRLVSPPSTGIITIK
ncbi:Hypothetical predicted protein, partial [Mytilus galloprovincialis]